MEKVAHKVKLFVWRVVQRIAPTKVCLQKKCVTSDNTCAVCGNQNETLKHIFFKCPLSSVIWNNVCPKVMNYVNLLMEDDKSWEELLNLLHKKKLIEQGIYILWTIWNNRNECYHNLRCGKPIYVKQMAINKAREFSEVNQKVSPTISLTKAEWIAPSWHSYKIMLMLLITIHHKWHVWVHLQEIHRPRLFFSQCQR